MHSNPHKRTRNLKKRLGGLVLTLLLAFTLVTGSEYAYAQGEVPVGDNKGLLQSLKDTAQSVANTAQDIANRTGLFDEESIVAQAFKSALNTFLKKFVADVGTWIGSGGKGQQPLFVTQGWDAYLRQAGDQALGEFVYEVGKGLNEIYQENERARVESQQVRDALGSDEDAYEDYMAQVEFEAAQCTVGTGASSSDAERQRCIQDAKTTALSEAVRASDGNIQAAYDECLDAEIERLSDSEDASVPFSQIEGNAASACDRTVTQNLIGTADALGTAAANAAAGGLAQVVNSFTADLCNPSSINVSLAINLKLQGDNRQQTACSFTQIRERLSDAVENSNFTFEFNQYWNTNQNDIGVALTLWDRQLNEKLNAEKQQALERVANNGFEDATEGPSNFIITPAATIRQQLAQAQDDAGNKDNIYTGTVADLVVSFVDSLVGGLFQRLQDGLASPTDVAQESFRTGQGFEALSSFSSSPASSGIAGAELRFAGLKKIDFSGGGAFEVINALSSCPNPNKPGPTDCVITGNFRDAVIEQLTVAEAIESGNLDPDLPIGFSSEGLEPPFNEGYPYRSLVILRKYRIIPVGWELAALYVRNYSGETTSLGAVVDAFDDPGSPFYKLIDPNWVLKSPENFCALKGPGPEIITQQIIDGNDLDGDGRVDGVNDARAALTVDRDAEYCADERSCLETNEDGSCKFYGYCTQDKPVWDFQGEACEPNFNTCEIFQDPNGATTAYLRNTLDTVGCNADNAGCRWYCTDQNPLTGDWACTDIQGDKIHLDRDASECPKGAAGCTKYYSTEGNQGNNLIPNSSFERYNGTPNDGNPDTWLLPSHVTYSGVSPQIVTDPVFLGRSANSLPFNGSTSIFVDTGEPVRGKTFLFSVFTNSCQDLDIQIESDSTALGLSTPVNVTSGAEWERSSVFYTYSRNPVFVGSNFVRVDLTNNTNVPCYVDGLMLEEGDSLSGYNEYEQSADLFIKTPPPSLNCSTSNPNRSSLCDNYTLTCTQQEVGCKLYEPTRGGQSIPAIAQGSDFCPNECVGYDVFKQEQTFFEGEIYPTYFIPTTASICTAQDAGCDEFTNLDEVALGAENREYYKYLRQCVKPAAANSCETFFSWVGTSSTGYQLISEQLEGDTTAGNNGPSQITSIPVSTLGSCNNSDDAINNPECREYFDLNGGVHYIYHRATTICSNECVPLRKTESDQTTCQATGGSWIVAENYCLYNAVLQESSQCTPQVAGCREYTGNAATNIREVYKDNFEDGDIQGWSAGVVSTESITPGGHSIKSLPGGTGISSARIDSSIFLNDNLTDGKVYEINFWARGDIGGAELFIDVCRSANPGINCTVLNNGGVDMGLGTPSPGNGGNSILISSQWNRHTFGPFRYDEAAALAQTVGGNDETQLRLIFLGYQQGGGFVSTDFYLDNISITEVQDSVYAVKNSWDTPLSCDNLNNDPYGAACADGIICNGTVDSPCRCSGPGVIDPDGPAGPVQVSQVPFQLGCAEYREGRDTVTLSSFTNLCSEDAIMCEALIDTKNSSDFLDKWDFALCVGNIDANGDCTIRRSGIAAEAVCTPATGQTTCRFTLIDSKTANSSDYITDENSRYTEEDEIVYVVNDPTMSCLSEEFGCKALGNPNEKIEVKPTIRITQNGKVQYATQFVGSEVPEEMYQKSFVEKLNYVNGKRVTGPGEVNVFVYEYKTATTTKYNLFFRTDQLETGGYPGGFSADFPTVPVNASVIKSDDVANPPAQPSDELQINSVRWGWTEPGDDGGIIEIPTNGSWRFDIDVNARTNYCVVPGNVVAPFTSCTTNSDCNAGEVCKGPRGNFAFISGSGERLSLDDEPSAAPEDNIIIEFNPTGFIQEGFNYSTNYIFDRPDEYDQTLCTSDTLYCQEYTTGNGVSYFKDPRERVCEWRQSNIGNEGYKWYKKKTNNSDPDVECPVTTDKTIGDGVPIETPIGECSNGSACSTDTDCQFGSCNFYAASCPVAQSSCREYIDPVTPYGTNLVFNGDFEQNVDGDGIPDGWDIGNPLNVTGAVPTYIDGVVHAIWNNFPSASGGNSISQNPIVLEPNTMYTLKAKIRRNSLASEPALVTLGSCTALQNGQVNPYAGEVYSPDNSMVHLISDPANGGCGDIIGNPAESISLYLDASSLESNDFKEYSGRFVTSGFTSWRLVFGAASSDPLSPANFGHHFEEISIVKTGVYYNRADTIDDTGCNGVVDLGEGCVPFNARVVGNDGALSKQIYDADASIADGLASTECENGLYPTLCDSNTIVKVRPDRQCAEWLTCSSTLVETGISGVNDQCLDFSLCRSIDPDTGECNRTVPRLNTIENVTLNKSGSAKRLPLSLASSLTGYSKAGVQYTENNIVRGTVEGLVPFDQMTQIGQPVFIENGNFETYTLEGQPTGWVEAGGQEWNDQQFKVIYDPVSAQTELADNRLSPEGRAFLRIGSSFVAVTDFLPVSAGTTYIISGYINTSNLNAGEGDIRVEEYDQQGNAILGNALNFNYTGREQALPFLDSGNGWSFEVAQFTTNPLTTSIRVQIGGSQNVSSQGKVYYDNIEIKPALQTQVGLVNYGNYCVGGTASPGFGGDQDVCTVNSDCSSNVCTGGLCQGGSPISSKRGDGDTCFYDDDCASNICGDSSLVPDNFYCDSTINDGSCYQNRDCRLFPERGSLSCEYFDNNGLTVRGLPGFCVQYDPNNKNICLQWWPVDRIVGDAIDDVGETYAGRTPLYMCLQARFGTGSFFHVGRTPWNCGRRNCMSIYGTMPGSTGHPYNAVTTNSIRDWTNIVNVTATRDPGWGDNSWVRTTETLSFVQPPSGPGDCGPGTPCVGICTSFSDAGRDGHNAGHPMTYRTPLTDCNNPAAAPQLCGCASTSQCDTAGGEICAAVWLWEGFKSSGSDEGGHIRDMRLIWQLGTIDWQYEYITIDRSADRDWDGDYSEVSIEYRDPTAAAIGTLVPAPDDSHIGLTNVTENPATVYWVEPENGNNAICTSGTGGAGSCNQSYGGATEMPQTVDFAYGATEIGGFLAEPTDVIGIEVFTDIFTGVTAGNPTNGNGQLTYAAPDPNFEGWCVNKGDVSRGGFCTTRNGGPTNDCNQFRTINNPRIFAIPQYSGCNSDADCALPGSSGTHCVNVWYHWGNDVGADGVAEMLVYSNVDPNVPDAWMEWWAGSYSCNCSSNLNAGLPTSARVEINYSSTGQLCSDIAQVVTPSGEHTAWTGRVSEGSSYQVPELNISHLSDYKPFGGIVSPEPPGFPSQWDARPNVCVDPAFPNIVPSDSIPCISSADCAQQPVYIQCGFIGNDPLPISTPDRKNYDEPYQARAGTPYACTEGAACPIGVCSDSLDVCLDGTDCESSICCTPNSTDVECTIHPGVPNYQNSTSLTDGINQVKRLFARSYGVWHWDGSQYIETPSQEWLPPSVACLNNIRPAYDPSNPSTADLCGVAPVIGNIKTTSLQTQGSNLIDNTGFINLSFTANVDFNQSPLTRIMVDWGDGNTSIVASDNIRPRNSAHDPHQFYHLYSYWDLKGLDPSTPLITCPNGANYCDVIVRIQVKDNWGWCNAYDPADPLLLGLFGEQCDTLTSVLSMSVAPYNASGPSAWTNPGTVGTPISIIRVSE